MIQNTIVFIKHSTSDLTEKSRFDKEFIKYYEENTMQIERALRSEFQNVIVYLDPNDFIENIDTHLNDIVISEWKHSGDRNSKTLIPNVCERYEISYVGSDPYVHVLCQDKHLSKLYAEEFNIHSSNSIRVDSVEDLQLERFLRLDPTKGLIIKPVYESESQGINDDSLQYNIESAYQVAQDLYNKINDSIIIEEYISGDEINVAFMLDSQRGLIYNEIIIGQEVKDQAYIITYDNKRDADLNGMEKRVVNRLDTTTLQSMYQLFFSIGKTNYLRIDGRINETGFQLIEITQSPGLAENGVFHTAFKNFYSTYSEFLKSLVMSALIDKSKIPNRHET